MKINLQNLAESLGGELIGNPHHEVSKVASLGHADSHSVVFFSGNSNNFGKLDKTQAGVVLLTVADIELYSGNKIILDNVSVGFASAVNLFNPRVWPKPFVAPTAIIDPLAVVDPTAHIGHYVVIHPQARIGANVVIGEHCVIGTGASIGVGSVIDAHGMIYRKSIIGQNCYLAASVTIGAEGFRVEPYQGRWTKVPHIGNVEIADDVEIGAHSTVDRGTVDSTRIGRGVKMDNHVHIGHNVEVGEHCIFAASAAIAGSAKIGNHCQFGGVSAVKDHVQICDNVLVAAKSFVTRSIQKPGIYSSQLGAENLSRWYRMVVTLKKLSGKQKVPLPTRIENSGDY